MTVKFNLTKVKRSAKISTFTTSEEFPLLLELPEQEGKLQISICGLSNESNNLASYGLERPVIVWFRVDEEGRKPFLVSVKPNAYVYEALKVCIVQRCRSVSMGM